MTTIQINKYLLFILVGILGIFAAYNMGILGFILMCSIFGNFFFLKKMLQMQDHNENLEEDLTQLYKDIDGFSEHLDRINSMHFYHMDDNILGMITHSRKVLNSLIDFQVEYSTEPVIVVSEDDEQYDEEEQEEE